MTSAPDCLNCIHCKAICNHTRLSCSERCWEGRIVKLNRKEANYGRIRHRALFIKARHCDRFDNMTVEEGGKA